MADPPPSPPKDRIVREQDETPAQAAIADFLQARLDEGWTRDGHWCHPSDPDKWMVIDPSTGEVTFSKPYARELAADPAAAKFIAAICQHREPSRRGGQR